MRSRLSALFFALSASFLAWGQNTSPQTPSRNGGDFSSATQAIAKVPTGVILVKGAWASASDSVTPVPESANVTNGVFSNPYFGLTFKLPADWTERYKGPPPSENGRYVLAQLSTANTYKGPAHGSILITAEDMFFTPLPATNPLELINYSKNHLQTDYHVEMPPTQTTIAQHTFTFWAYWSPVAQLHWYVLAIQARCHTLEIVLSSRDTKLLENLLLDMNRMSLREEASPEVAAGGEAVPVCIKDYARENVTSRVDPVFTQHRFNPVPVRIIIDKQGKIKNIHFLSAFPDQAKAITDALMQWKFKRHLLNGRPAEVETGILFGRPALPANATTATGGTPQQ